MKLLKKIKNNKISINLRNLLSIKSVDMSLNSIHESSSCSDTFCWRTDNGYETVVKFSDILKLFYDQTSLIVVDIYNHQNKHIKNVSLKNPKISNSILISKKNLNGLEDFGYFTIHHYSKKITANEKIIISNRCYVGYSYKNSLPSFVHGNAIASHSNINVRSNNNKFYKEKKIIQISPILNQNYKVQNNFNFYDKVEVFLSNPTDQLIKFNLEKKNYNLENGRSLILKISNKNEIMIKSNCLFLRPIIFCYKSKKYIDVYHG